MSKGSGRRPMQISQEELDKRWEAVFNGKPAEDMFDHLMIDKILTKEVEKLVPDDEVAVLLSGGVDSISVAFAAETVSAVVAAIKLRITFMYSSLTTQDRLVDHY